METTTPTNALILRCLAEYGIVLQGIEVVRNSPAMGAAAIVLNQGTAVVTGFTPYRNVTMATACPTPILREGRQRLLI